MTASKAILEANGPQQWAEFPDWITFSFAKDAEACPRRASLRRSDYGDLWDRKGYPPAFSAPFAKGSIVHASLGNIVQELSNAGCTSLQDERVFAVLKEMGGLSSVIARHIRSWLLRCDENPRQAREKATIQQQLERKIPDMRVTLQRLLSSRHWQIPERNSTGVNGLAVSELRLGCHFEVELRHQSLSWRGIVDLIEIAPHGGISITDFKTGEPKPEDKEQLLLYALLWARDSRRNPAGLLAHRLVLSYFDSEVEVPSPSADDLRRMEIILSHTSEALQQSFKRVPPRSHRSVETCPTCDVRHLCEEYWSLEEQEMYTDSDFGDYELILDEKMSESTWKARCYQSNLRNVPQRLILHSSYRVLPDGVIPGDHLRVLGAAIRTNDAEQPIITVTSATEVFKAPPCPDANARAYWRSPK